MVATSVASNVVQIIDGSSDEDNAPSSPVVAVKPTKKAANGKTGAPSSALKKRRTSSTPAPATQKNTLDSWFGVAKKPAPKRDEPMKQPTVAADGEDDDQSESMETGTPTPVIQAVQKTQRSTVNVASPNKPQHKNKKLLQRRILLGDQCRVCDSAKTESSMRCERKCMDCEMTVHMSCYGVDDDEEVVPEKWRCRPCQATFDLTQEPSNEDNEEVADDEEGSTTVRGIPAHEPRGEKDCFGALYNSSEFASVFLFIKRFRRLGLKLGAEVTIQTLALALLSPRDHVLLQDLHTRLLQNLGVTISKTHNWVENLIRFLKTSEYALGAELVRRLAACGNANDWLSTYYDVPVVDRVALLKLLCEAQFDENDSLVEKIGQDDTTPESLRDDPLGDDAKKRSYYLLEDPPTFADGTAWLCRCQSRDGSKWETLSDDLASLQSFVDALSYSKETADLQLWQALSCGVLKSMERREKKKIQQAQRMSRMPRLLGNAGLDTSSILPENYGESSGRRSLRTRRAVNYRSYAESEEEESEPELDDEEEEGGEDDEEEEDEDDEEEQEEGQEQRESPSRKRRRLPEEQPSRTSRRLRGGSSPTRSSRRQQKNSGSGSDSENDKHSGDDNGDDTGESDGSE